MSFDNIYITAAYSAVVIGLLCVFILLFANKTHRHANRLLAMATFILVVSIAVNALVKSRYFFIDHPHLFRASWPLLYMFMPVTYLYIRAVVKDETGFKKWDWVHFIPAFLHLCELLPLYVLPTDEKRHFIETLMSDPSKLNNLSRFMLSPHIHNTIKAVLGCGYMIFALELLRRYRTSIASRSPDRYKKIYSWLLTLTVTILTMYVLTLLFLFVLPDVEWEINLQMALTMLVIFFLCIYLLFVPSILFGLPIVRKELIVETKPVTELPVQPTDNITKKPDDPDRYSYLEAYKPLLEMHFEDAKPYLKQGYSINDLAKETGIPLHHLTALLNKGYHERFNDFINRYRIEYLEKNFKQEWEMLTMEGIGKEIGFSSRTTFYNVIKKFTGLAPREYFESRRRLVQT